jgi:DNA-binding NarL/FixJ family response regulator
VLVMSMKSDEAYVLEALKHGAAGYILKQSDIHDVVRAVRDVLAGLKYLSPQLSQRAIETYRQKAEAATADPYDALTSREREVLQLAAEGRTSAEVAELLFISQRTAEMHRANLMRKLGLRTQTDLVRYAMWRGILPSEP